MFNVIDIPKPKEEKTTVKEPLPMLHTLFIGSTGQGKTNLILNMILRNKMYGYLSYYKKIYILSPSACIDNSFAIVNEYIDDRSNKKNSKLASIELIPEYNNEILEDIIEEIKEDKERGRTLILLDDCMNELSSNIKQVQTLFSRGRHYKISVWVSTQSYKKINKVLRTNSNDIIIFGDSSKRELSDLYEEFGTGSFEEFFEMYQKATEQQYSFLQIRAKYGKKRRYTSNFNKFL